MICVYKITSPSGKIYIGSTINFKDRIKHYKCLDCKPQRKLYNSLKKHGFFAHIVEVVELCTLDNMLERERHYGLLFNVLCKNGLNLSLPGEGEKAILISEESLEHRRLSQAGSGNNFYGRKHSDASILKMKLSHSNKSAETIEKMRKAQLGKKATEEARTKMAVSQTGRKHSEQTKLKMRKSNQNLKVVLCLRTGIFYNGAKEAALTYGFHPSTLKNKLNGARKNNTSLIYV